MEGEEKKRFCFVFTFLTSAFGFHLKVIILLWAVGVEVSSGWDSQQVASCDPVTPFAILKTFRPENQPESSGFHSGSGKQGRQRTSLKWGGVGWPQRGQSRDLGFPGGSDGKETACNAGDPDLIPRLGRFPGEENGKPLQYPRPGESHGQRSLMGYTPWGGKELDTTEMSAPMQDQIGPEWWLLFWPQVASTLDLAMLYAHGPTSEKGWVITPTPILFWGTRTWWLGEVTTGHWSFGSQCFPLMASFGARPGTNTFCVFLNDS